MLVKCPKCLDLKESNLFYESSKNCKECVKKRVRENRLAKLDYYQNYDRNRPNKEERAKQSAEYHKTEKGKEVRRKATKNYRKDKLKYSAVTDLGNAIKYGRITKPHNCQNCGVECNTHGHHDDYNKALDVRWLCNKCHTDFHNTVREKQRELEKQGLSDLFDSHKLIKHVAKTYWNKS